MLSRSQAAAVAAAIKYGTTVSVLGNGTHHVRIGPMGNSADFRIPAADVDYVIAIFEELETLRNAQSSNNSPELSDRSDAGASDVLCDDQGEEVPSHVDEQREHVSAEASSDPDVSVDPPVTRTHRKRIKPAD
jgi:hypothetical protein